MNLRKRDERYVARDGLPKPIEVTAASGSYVFSHGKKYIDFVMGWNVGNIGWNVPEVMAAMKMFEGPVYVKPPYLYKRWVDLAELLATITPGKLTKSFRATGGTEAVEIALQCATVHTKRTKFISIEGSYHGHSIATMSIGDSYFRNHFKNLLGDCFKINPPLNRDAALKVEKIVKKEDIAAFISEPIICNLGVLVPDEDFFGIVSDACKKYGTLLIMDEVATGFGRTGKLFASEHYTLKPDIITLGKGITSGYGSLGATIVTKEIAKSMEFDFSTYSTFGWLPISVEGAIANINYILKKRLWKNAEKMGDYFEQQLKKISFKHRPETRIKGLAIGVEFEKEGYVIEVMKKAMSNGLLFSTLNRKIITLFPALTINKKVVDEGLKILEKSVIL